MLRVISEVKPTYIVGENVYGLTNWNEGVVFEEVCAELESLGYEVQPVLLPASGIGAPHHRMRVWFVAYAINNRHSSNGRKISEKDRIQEINRQEMASWEFDRTNISGNAADTDNEGSQEWSINQRNDEEGWQESSGSTEQYTSDDCKTQMPNWDNFPSTQPTICSGDDGFSHRLDGITFPKWRQQSIMAYGNAVVPQLVYQIFKAIDDTKRTHTSSPRPQDG
jgi:DNA (cytosine-5)-methyltransferase 1